MKYQIFLAEMEKAVNKKLNPEMYVEMKTVRKNNGVYKNCMTLHPKVSSVSPVLYLDDYYPRCQDLSQIDPLAEEIAGFFRSHTAPFSLSNLLGSYPEARPNICVRLIHTEKNIPFLKDVPHLPFLDLSLIFQYQMVSDHLQASIVISDSILSYWEITPEYFLNDIRTSCLKNLHYEFSPLEDILLGKRPCVPSDSSPSLLLPDSPPVLTELYALTNHERIFGAAGFFFPSVLKTISDYFSTDLYILPSSIHEILILPVTDENDTELLNQIVGEVNRTEMVPEDILSDHIYHYSRKNEEITGIPSDSCVFS